MAQEFSKKLYNSKEWHAVRMLALQRDRYMCTGCGDVAQEVHHIVHLTKHNINDPNITLSLDNLTSLCKDCHNKIHERGKYKRLEHTECGMKFDENGNPIPPI